MTGIAVFCEESLSAICTSGPADLGAATDMNERLELGYPKRLANVALWVTASLYW